MLVLTFYLVVCTLTIAVFSNGVVLIKVEPP
jgi:hypothetical protein